LVLEIEANENEKKGDGGNIIFDDFREAYRWLNYNTAPDARVMSWWDYGASFSSLFPHFFLFSLSPPFLWEMNRLSNLSNGQSHNSRGQQHLEQFSHCPSWKGNANSNSTHNRN
jgi:hypothetical protein